MTCGTGTSRNLGLAPDPTEAVRCYSVAEAAQHIGMSRGWLYARIREGALPVVEFGDTRAHTRVRADHLQAFIDRHTHGARPALATVPAATA